MNMPVAVVIGAVLISGSLLWTGDRVSRDARCAGYLASPSGGEALFNFSLIEAGRRKQLAGLAVQMGEQSGDAAAAKRLLDEDKAGAAKSAVFLDSLLLAGCYLNPPN